METYEEFINNILEIRGRFACGDEYHERHHIVPKCIGGTNDVENLIDLYAREHFEAHRLLALENPEDGGLVYAWNMMCNSKHGDYQITAEEYEEARVIFAKMISGENHPMYGKHRSKESRKKMSENHRDCSGENNPNYGRTWWDEDTPQEKIDEWKKHISESISGMNNPNYGSNKFAGENNPMFGKHHSEKTKRKISDAQKGKYNGSNHPRSRKVICLLNLKIYGYLNKAAKDNHISKNTMRKYCLEHKNFMYYDEWLTQQND